MPHFYVLVISCALTKVQIEYFESYCKELGFNTVTIWTSSVIEAMLLQNIMIYYLRILE